jgi:hypothetical protein
MYNTKVKWCFLKKDRKKVLTNFRMLQFQTDKLFTEIWLLLDNKTWIKMQGYYKGNLHFEKFIAHVSKLNKTQNPMLHCCKQKHREFFFINLWTYKVPELNKQGFEHKISKWKTKWKRSVLHGLWWLSNIIWGWVKDQFMSLLSQENFRNSRAAFIKLWSPLSEMHYVKHGMVHISFRCDQGYNSSPHCMDWYKKTSSYCFQ